MSFSDVLSNTNSDLFKLCDSHAYSNASALVHRIKSLPSVPHGPSWQSSNLINAICDRYAVQFCQSFKEEYQREFKKIEETNILPRPRVLRSVSETDEVLEEVDESQNDNVFKFIGTDVTELHHPQLPHNGVTNQDNNEAKSSFPKSYNFHRRMSAGDIAVPSHSFTNDFETSKKNKKHFLKRGLSFQGTTSSNPLSKKEEAIEHTKESSGKNKIVSSVWNRLRRGSYSSKGKVSLLFWISKIFFDLNNF